MVKSIRRTKAQNLGKKEPRKVNRPKSSQEEKWSTRVYTNKGNPSTSIRFGKFQPVSDPFYNSRESMVSKWEEDRVVFQNMTKGEMVQDANHTIRPLHLREILIEEEKLKQVLEKFGENDVYV